MPPQFPNTDIGIAGVAPDLALQWHALLYRELPGEGINDGHWIDL